MPLGCKQPCSGRVYWYATFILEAFAVIRFFCIFSFIFFAIALAGAHSAIGADAQKPDGKKVALPAAAQRAIDFDADIKPILTSTCVQCHGSGKSKGEFRIDTRATILKGGESGPGAAAGDGANSLIVQLVAGADEDRIMPKKGRRLTAEEVGVLRAWIDQGMKWPDGITFGAGKAAPLLPRIVALPAGADPQANPIDQILAPYFAKAGVKTGAIVDDSIYARRVWLDITGLLPPPEELESFIADAAADKREKLVWRLLNDKTRYAQNWLSFWNDLLRNDYAGTGYIDGGRKQITPWLYKALSDNMPFDQFVRELVTGANGSEGFIKGIVWRGVVNAAQTPQMQAAQNISQVFMGANLKCASCHDSFVSQWLLADSYGLAGVFADQPLEMERCATPTGKIAPMKFLYPELGAIDAKLPRDQRLAQLAAIITNEKNGRLSRTIVNRLWKKFLGRALVEPVDEMDRDPWNADLLDWLAVDLATTNQWDLKKTIARILTSKAYQMPMVAVAEGGLEQFTFRGPVARRMTGEEFVDAVSTVSGAWTSKSAFNPAAGASRLTHKNARWIWSIANANQSAPPGTIYLRKELSLDNVTSGEAIVTCDNEFVLYVNGKEVARSEVWNKPVAIDLKPYLISNSVNTIAAEATNTTNSPSPAGFFLSGKIVHRKVNNNPPIELASDKTWRWSDKADPGWKQAVFNSPTWKPAIELGDTKLSPWNLDATLKGGIDTIAPIAMANIRSALCTANPLTTAMGRSPREQVMTDRPSVATTLEALEMSNGSTLAEMLKKGAAKLLADKSLSSERLIELIFHRALGRKPTDAEMQSAIELVGSPAKAEGVEDLLWIVAMLPEFQLIR
jgi:mono/diheme cytochrome c family protein